MPRTAPTALTAALVLAAGVLGACGEDDPVIPPASDTSTSEPSWPVTIARTGGVAGFSDSLSVQSDGTVIGRTKQGDVRCTLEASALDALREGAAPIQDTDVPTLAPTGMADHLSVLHRCRHRADECRRPAGRGRRAGGGPAARRRDRAGAADRTICT